MPRKPAVKTGSWDDLRRKRFSKKEIEKQDRAVAAELAKPGIRSGKV